MNDPVNSERQAGETTLTGVKAGRYEVRERLGAGGMGEVYRAWDTLLERWVAIKRPSPASGMDDIARKRLLREARSASALQHHAIAGIFDVLDTGSGDLLIVQELVPGVPLRQKLGQPFPLDEFFTIATECASALAAAAEKGIVHCDIKPENILITDEGRPKILDFGIARRFELEGDDADQRTKTIITETLGGTSGTPAYMAPEVIDGQTIDARVDIFALGVVFYEVLTGVNPFQKESLSKTLVSVVSEAPILPSARRPDGPAALDAIVMRMLAKDREARYATPKELLDDLRAATTGTFVIPPGGLPHAATVAGMPTTHIPTGHIPTTHFPTQPVVRPAGKLRRAVMALGGMAAVILIAIAVLTARRAFMPPEAPTTSVKSTSTIPYLAVEPFKNLAEDPKAEFFAVGLTEALQSRLAGIKGMYVVDAGSELGVKTTLEGGVQRSNDRLRITYRIVDRESGENIGGGVIEGGISELFDLQDRATREISSALAEEFGLAAISEPAPRPTTDVTAYDLYLQARGYLRRFEDERNVEIAIEVFQKALERDPGMPLALAGLGEAYWKRYEKTKDPRWAAMAEEEALRALKKDATLAESHVSLGTIYLGTGKADSARVAFTQAVTIDPGSDAAYRGLAKAHEGIGDLVAAEQTFEKAIAAKPDYWAGHNDLGGYYYRHGEFEKAAQCFQRVVDLTPDNPRGYSNLGAMYASLDRAKDAVVAYEKSLALKPNYRAYSNLATMYNGLGQGAEAAEMYEKALELDDRDYRVWASLGAVLRGLSGREASVDSAFRRAVDLAEAQLMINPNDALLLAFLAEHHAILGDDERAGELAKRAVEIAPKQVDVLVRAAGAYEEIGQRAKALATIRTAIEGGWNPEAPGADSPLAPLFADPKFREIVDAAQTAKKQ